MTTIVALGDSTTAGTPGWLSPLEHPPDGMGDPTSSYTYWLMRAHPEWRVLNRGVNGERSDQILARFERHVVGENARAVVIIAGVNDVYQGLEVEDVTAALRQLYDRAIAAGLLLTAGTIVPYNTATAVQNERMHEINAWIRGRARRDPRIGFADTRAAVASRGNSDLLRDTPDGLHPSPDGYRRMAEALRPVLERQLQPH
ncbi:MAG TPA: GDSL-type esterase/lipase family protein [Vicinamibacterales bacterium]|nr:GDSL-type esterase/lipase family protein [Vicinamibacterales bacterium]